MSRWWRAYDEALHDPKLIALPDKLFRVWFNLLCVASKHGGVLPATTTIAIELRVSVHKAAEWVTALKLARLLDEVEAGKFAPHNWKRRQFQSDVSTDRVKRFRQQQRNVSYAVSETPPENRDREQNTEKKTISGDRDATRPDAFEEFWSVYPKREGANPKQPARKLFLAALKAGATAEEIVRGARACAIRDRDKIGTPYIPQAVKWLRDQRWRDYAAAQPSGSGPQAYGWTPGKRTAEQILADLEKPDGEAGKGDKLEQTSSVDEDGSRLRGTEPKLFRGDDENAGVRSVAQVLSTSNALGANDLPRAAGLRSTEGGMDGTLPIPRVASRF